MLSHCSFEADACGGRWGAMESAKAASAAASVGVAATPEVDPQAVRYAVTPNPNLPRGEDARGGQRGRRGNSAAEQPACGCRSALHQSVTTGRVGHCRSLVGQQIDVAGHGAMRELRAVHPIRPGRTRSTGQTSHFEVHTGDSIALSRTSASANAGKLRHFRQLLSQGSGCGADRRTRPARQSRALRRPTPPPSQLPLACAGHCSRR